MTKVSTPQSKGQAKAEPKKEAKAAAKPAPAAAAKPPAPAADAGTWLKNKAAPAAKASPKQEAFQAAKPGDPRPGTARTTSAPEVPIPTSGVGKLLNDAQPPGTYFKLKQRESGRQGGDEAPDAELAAAVEEAARLLAEVGGVEGVAPGENDAHQPVVVIQAGKGFTQTSLSRIPERVGRFATLLALPYELLPLRK